MKQALKKASLLPHPNDRSTCLVTGASSGIGREFARQLASRGLGVTLVARREQRLRELAAELQSEHGVTVDVIAADLADADARKALVEGVKERGRAVDLLVNNAGIVALGEFWKIDLNRQLDELRLNCEAVVHLTREYLPGMVERNRGGVINVASMAAFYPMPFEAIYAASKSFVLSFSEALSDELRNTAVTVTAVSPGPVPTEMAAYAGDPDLERAPSFSVVSPEKVASDAIRAFDKGRRGIVPGLANTVITHGTRPVPTSIKLFFTRRIFRELAAK